MSGPFQGLDWQFHPPFSIAKPGATVFIGTVSIVHSMCHIPHMLMYRRLGMFTAFWSLVGLGLIFGAILEQEVLYDVWIWYSCVYVPVMLVVMYVVLTGAVWALDIQPLRAVFATVAILFYLFMFYCIVYVMSEKRKLFTTTTAPGVHCRYCPECTTVKCTTPKPVAIAISKARAAISQAAYNKLINKQIAMGAAYAKEMAANATAAKAAREKAEADLKAAEEEREKAEADAKAAKEARQKAEADTKAAKVAREKGEADAEAAKKDREKAEAAKAAKKVQEKAEADAKAAKAASEKAEADKTTAAGHRYARSRSSTTPSAVHRTRART